MAPLPHFCARIVWRGEAGEVDAWDCRLIHACQAAAAFADEHDLQHQLSEGLEQFVSGQETNSRVTVGLCMATMNRLWQLRIALPLTLAHCWEHRRWVKVHVVDFGSTDGTLCWLLQECRAAIDVGLLLVYRCDQRYWHASVAKNTSHIVATEDILVNVDSDNIVGLGFPLHVRGHFERGEWPVSYHCGEGTCGRIAMKRIDFLWIRGYDEDAHPMGAQDVDVFRRLSKLPSARPVHSGSEQWSQAVKNTLDEKVANCDKRGGSLSWNEMNRRNWSLLKKRREQGLLRRNMGVAVIGAPVVQVCFHGERWRQSLERRWVRAQQACQVGVNLPLAPPAFTELNEMFQAPSNESQVPPETLLCEFSCGSDHVAMPASEELDHLLFGQVHLVRSETCSAAWQADELSCHIDRHMPGDCSLNLHRRPPILQPPVVEVWGNHASVDDLTRNVAPPYAEASSFKRTYHPGSDKYHGSAVAVCGCYAMAASDHLQQDALPQLGCLQCRVEPGRVMNSSGPASLSGDRHFFADLWTLWVDPKTRNRWYYNERTGECSWEAPPAPCRLEFGSEAHAEC